MDVLRGSRTTGRSREELSIETMSRSSWNRYVLLPILLGAGGFGLSCGTFPDRNGEDSRVTTLGTIEVTARLIEIPEGAIFRRELYDYATVLKYEVIEVHRGDVIWDTIFVGHYNPFKPRSEAADQRVRIIGGNLHDFRTGQIHQRITPLPTFIGISMSLMSSIDFRGSKGISTGSTKTRG